MRHSLHFINGLKRHAQQSRNDVQDGITEGLVSAFDPDTQSAKVTLQPDGTETGWIQVKTPWTGNGWGLFCPPSIGQAVTIHYENGDLNQPSIGLRAHNDVDKPLATPSGEFWLVHASGQCIKLTNDGKMTIGGTASAVGTILIGNPAALHQLMTEIAMAVYNAHTHPANGQPPTQQMNSTDHLTQQTKAS